MAAGRRLLRVRAYAAYRALRKSPVRRAAMTVETPHRRRRLLTRRTVRDTLVSLSELRSVTPRGPDGDAVGHLVDVVVRWDGTEPYPLVSGIVVRFEGKEIFASAGELALLGSKGVQLAVPVGSLQDFVRRPGELRLVDEVLGRQVVDVDGVQVLRAGELWLATVLGRMRLVGVEPERRFRWRRHSASHGGRRLVDWAGAQPLGEPGSELRLRLPHEGLRQLRPGELADLMENLDRAARDELASSLEPTAVADALEEMEPEPIKNLLRDAPKDRAAELVAAMEPDEAADALRDLERGEADAIIARLPPELARQLTEILGYPETMAGGFMTTILTRARADDTVGDVQERMSGQKEHSCDIDGVVVVDDQGRLLADISLFDLFTTPTDTVIGDLVGEVPPVAVSPEALLDEVVDRLTDARRHSVVVVDDADRPIGRVMADDVVDALSEGGLRMRLPWLFR